MFTDKLLISPNMDIPYLISLCLLFPVWDNKKRFNILLVVTKPHTDLIKTAAFYHLQICLSRNMEVDGCPTKEIYLESPHRML